MLRIAHHWNAFQKWVKRHPSLASTASIVAISVLAIAGLTIAFLAAQTLAAQSAANSQASELRNALPETLAMLRSPGGEAELFRNGLEDGERILKCMECHNGRLSRRFYLESTSKIGPNRSRADNWATCFTPWEVPRPSWPGSVPKIANLC